LLAGVALVHHLPPGGMGAVCLPSARRHAAVRAPPRLEQGHGLLGDRMVDEGHDGRHHPHGYVGAAVALTITPQGVMENLVARGGRGLRER
jgi:hypothetical protein